MHRLAWTVADLRGVSEPGPAELDTALRLRTGEPLMLDQLGSPDGSPSEGFDGDPTLDTAVPGSHR